MEVEEMVEEDAEGEENKKDGRVRDKLRGTFMHHLSAFGLLISPVHLNDTSTHKNTECWCRDDPRSLTSASSGQPPDSRTSRYKSGTRIE